MFHRRNPKEYSFNLVIRRFLSSFHLFFFREIYIVMRYDAQNQKYIRTNPGFGLGVKVFSFLNLYSPWFKNLKQYLHHFGEPNIHMNAKRLIWFHIYHVKNTIPQFKVHREEYGIESIREKPILDKTYGASGKVSVLNVTRYHQCTNLGALSFSSRIFVIIDHCYERELE